MNKMSNKHMNSTTVHNKTKVNVIRNVIRNDCHANKDSQEVKNL